MDYNPHAPQVLGNEWTPIQQADLRTPATAEDGLVFRVGTVPVTPTFATFSPAESRYAPNSAQLINLYPTGTPPPEAQSGPIQTTLVSPDGWATISGTTTLVNAPTIGAALAQPFDGAYVNFAEAVGNTTLDIDLFFTVPVTLSGRRILSVEVEYAAISSTAAQNVTDGQYNGIGLLRPTNTSYVCWAALRYPTSGPTVLTGTIGEVNSFWRPAAVAGNPDDPTIMPWTYEQLQRFASGTSTTIRQAIRLVTRASTARNQSVQLHYAALKITHCIERRLLFGGWRVQKIADGYVAGSRTVEMRDPGGLTQGTIIGAAAPYTITTTNVYTPSAVPITNFADSTVQPSNPPLIRALRQLEKIPGVGVLPDVVAGVVINRPTQPGKIMSRSDTNVIPQLTLHDSAAILVGSHAYGLQIPAPVQASPAKSAIQGVLTAGKAAGGLYEWITFYARITDTVDVNPANQLTVTIIRNGGTVATPFITLADFLALPEIVDGWRRVRLSFPAVAIAAADTVTITWSTAYVGVWEVLAEDGPSQSAGQAFGAATYGGTGKSLNWVRTDGTSGADPLTDASFTLSLVISPVTGLTGTVLQHPVNDLLPGCEVCEDTRCCSVASVSYVHLSWDQATVPAGGFKEYRIYRIDPLGINVGGAVLIAVISSLGTTTFDDYEYAAGGGSSTVSYQVTVVDQAGIESAESDVTVTITDGGVTMSGTSCGDHSSVLVFTSNFDPGSTVAYPKIKDRGTPVDEFIYPDADEVDLERMYGRDCQVAFRPVEDGCEAFTCDLLVYESCDPQQSFSVMHNAIVPLRQMSRADVPYVVVRDTDGVRWLASVVVPSASVYRDRGVVIARSVQVVEVVQTVGPVTA